MLKRYIYTLLFLIVFLDGFSQRIDTCFIYTSKGKQITFDEMLAQIKKQEIILFGEIHNNILAHKLQLELFQAIANSQQVILGLEMLERHDQQLIDEYLQGVIDTSILFDEADLWSNFKQDYMPLLAFAKTKKTQVIASNMPRSISKQVIRKPNDYINSISNDSMKKMVCPLPFTLPEKAVPYKSLIKNDFGATHGMDTKKIVTAQAIKDATMAASIINYLQSGTIFLHINGDFHSKDYGGIVYWLKRYSTKKLKLKTISCVESDSFDFDKTWRKQADFIIVLHNSGPK